MRTTGLLRTLAVVSFLAAAILGLAAGLSFRGALGKKIDRVSEIERGAMRPAASARLACALLERRLASVSQPDSRAVAAAFQSADATRALADYREAGGDPAVLAEAQKALADAGPPGPDAEIALMRAVRALREEALRAPRVSRPETPPSASRAQRLLTAAGAAAAIAVLLAYLAGRFRA